MKDYHGLYLKLDVLPLADVFEKFRNNCLKNYGLCPSHYLSTPALCWNVVLNMTKVELDLILDPGMYKFFEKGARDGILYISIGYGKASNKYLKPLRLKTTIETYYILRREKYMWLCDV